MATSRTRLRQELSAAEPGTARMQRVNDNLYLLPTLTGHAWGASYRRKGMEYAVASVPEVVHYMRGVAQRALYKGQGILGTIRAATLAETGETTDWVNLDLEFKDNIDHYLVLTDTKRGQKGAMSIEFGRDAYTQERKDGTVARIGAMAGKFILHRAFGISPGGLRGTGGGNF